MGSASLPASTSISRRTVVKGTAWAAPAVVVASQVPAFAASPVPLAPGLNGWLDIKPGKCTAGQTVAKESGAWTEFQVKTPNPSASNPDYGMFVWNGAKGPDGKPAAIPKDTVSNVSLTIWVSGDRLQSLVLDQTSKQNGWRSAGKTVKGHTAGVNYTGFTFTYSGEYSVRAEHPDRLYVEPLSFSIKARLGDGQCPATMSDIIERHVTVGGEDLALARVISYSRTPTGWKADGGAREVEPILGTGSLPTPNSQPRHASGNDAGQDEVPAARTASNI